MILKANKRIGDTSFQFEFEGKDAFDVLAEAAQITSMPDYCPLCKNRFVNLEMNKGKGEKGEFTFVYVRCKRCGAKAQIGQYKSGGVFWKRFEQYGSEKVADTQADINDGEIPVVQDEVNDGEVPF